MKRKRLTGVVLAVAAPLAFAVQGPAGTWPAQADDVPLSMSTVLSVDWKTGGFKGWGPIPNLQTPWGPNESMPWTYQEEMRAHAMHVADVTRAREKVWLANAPLRMDYELRTAQARKGR